MGFGGLCCLFVGFGVLWWVSVMLVSFLLGFGVFFLMGFGVFLGFSGVSSHCALLSFFRSTARMLNYFIRSTQRHPIIRCWAVPGSLKN